MITLAEIIHGQFRMEVCLAKMNAGTENSYFLQKPNVPFSEKTASKGKQCILENTAHSLLHLAHIQRSENWLFSLSIENICFMKAFILVYLN